MATPSKRVPPSKGKRTPTPPASAARTRPFIRFYHSAALRKKTLSLLNTLERAKDSTQHRDALAALVAELTASGLDGYFAQPLKAAKPGFVIEQSANLGLAGAHQVMGAVIRQVIGRMEGPQLVSVCGSIRQLMR